MTHIAKKLTDITKVTRKLGKHFYTGVYRYKLKSQANTFANHLRKGAKGKRGHRARVIQLKSSPKNAVFVDGIKE